MSLAWWLRPVAGAYTAAALASCCSSICAAAAPADSVLKLHVMNFHGEAATGTAVVVAPGKLVTACHVTKDAVAIEVLSPHKTFQVARQRRDIEHDLCLLLVPDLPSAPVKLGANALLHEGTPVTGIGYPRGQERSLRQGVIQRLHRYENTRVIQSSTPFAYGDSGGGLFTADGALVGIMSFMLGERDPTNFALPVDWLPDDLTSNNDYTAVAPLSSGAPLFAKPLRALPHFLQAAKYERDHNWIELQRVAEQWRERERENPDAWFAHASALAELGDVGRAREDFEQLLRLDPDNALAWLRLGLLRAGHGNSSAMDAVLRTLAGMSRFEGATQFGQVYPSP